MQLASELEVDYHVTFKRLCAFFRGRGVSADEASDLAQETASKAWVHLKRNGRKLDDLDPLIYRIAKNVLVEFWRTKRVAIEPLDGHDIPSGAETCDVRDVDARLQAAWIMDGLSNPQRRALAMWVEGFRPAEIAKKLGIKRNAVDQLLHRARRALASRVEDRAAWGGIAVVFGRVRDRLRGFVRAVLSNPSVDAFGAQAIAIATVSLAAVLSFTGPAATGASRSDLGPSASVTESDDESMRSTERKAADGASARERGGPPLTEPAAPATEIGVGIREHRVDVVKQVRNPMTGEPAPLGIRVWHERDKEGERGITGPALDHATKTVCDGAPPICK